MYRIVNGIPTLASDFPFIVDVRNASDPSYSFCTGILLIIKSFDTFVIFRCVYVQVHWCSWSGQ